MTEQETGESASATPEQEEARISFKRFLETIHPAVQKKVSGLWSPRQTATAAERLDMQTPELRLHCGRCDGERTFRSDSTLVLEKNKAHGGFISYLCSDCRKEIKTFSLWAAAGETRGGVAYKYGERPPFGVPIPNRVLRHFGDDRENFIKGRQCENQGLGVGFSKAMEQIKTALPEGLRISGHNPLLALHNALSIGLHNESDAKCLEAAHDVRLVLTDLIERMSLLRRDKSELDGAVQRLIAKKGGA